MASASSPGQMGGDVVDDHRPEQDDTVGEVGTEARLHERDRTVAAAAAHRQGMSTGTVSSRK